MYFLDRAVAKMKLADLLGALADLNEAVEINAWSAEVHFYRGRVFQKLGDHNLSIKEFTTIIDLLPDCISARRFLGVSLVRINKTADGLREIDLLIMKIPDYWEAYFERGMIHRDLKNFDLAIADFSIAAENDNHLQSYFERCILHKNNGDFKAAVKDFKKTTELFPEFAQGFMNLGIVKGEMNDHFGAIDAFSKAIEINECFAQAYHYRAISKEKTGDKEGMAKDLTRYRSFMN